MSESLEILRQRRAQVAMRIKSYQALLVDYDAVIADLEKDERRRLPTVRRTGVKGVEGKLAGAFLTTTPPTIKVMIRAPEEEWTGRDAIPEVVAIEGALRDATFYLYGRKTGPGYTVTVKPTRLEGLWLVTRLSVIPVGEQDRARFVQKLVVARDRARAALTKTGARVIDENTPTEAPTGQEVAAG